MLPNFPQSMRTLFLLLATTAVLYADTTILNDPFSFPSSPGNTDTDVNLDVPARQAGGTATTTYTETVTGNAGNDAFLEDSTLVGSDVVNLHTIHGAALSQMALRANGSFGASLAGLKWTARFVARLDRSSTSISDAWLSFAIGDQADVVGPNSASADFALLVRGTAGWQSWADNLVLASGLPAALRSPDLWATSFTVTITVDETLAQPTAQATVQVGASTFDLGTWNVGFDNATDRFIEFRAHNGGNASGTGTIMDARVDVLVLTQINNIPQPPTITTGPVSQSLPFSQPFTLSVVASGSGPITYQWSRNNVPIPGATNATYAVASAGAADAGLYTIAVTNPIGTATADATVNVTFQTPQQATWEPPGPSNRRTGLVVSEIHYHPAPRLDALDLEFVELYNSNPWIEDLAGYRLTGDVSYTFPAGATIAAKGRVVIAHVPTDLQTVYGLSGVLGPFIGNLSNEGGTVRLRKGSDAIVQEVSWNDHAPWPVAADGTGHSLILVRPSYGAGDPRAWEASALRGGSPGAGDVGPGSAQDHVVINEVLARSDVPLVDFIELYNRSPLNVDISGGTLSDDPAALAKFVIPPGTVLPAGGFAMFDETQLGFALGADGETLYFTNAAGTRVLDAVRFGGQAANLSIGRVPNGLGDLRPLAARSPGAANAALRTPEVLVSEIFFNPITGDDLDEWLELTNTTGAPIDLSGWRFSDGISFTFPASTSIGAGGRLVVAKNAARTRANHPALNPALVFGDYSGTLGNGGDHLTLDRPETVGALTINVEVDSLTYRDGGRWSQWADGGGSSLEVTDLRADRSFASAWADSNETAKAPWTTVSVSGTLDLGNVGTTGADRVQLFLMGTGETLVDNIVVAPNGAGNVVTNGGFEGGLTGWTVQGNQSRSTAVAGQGVGGGSALRLRGTDDGDVEGNRVFSALTSTLAANTNATVSAQMRWLAGRPEAILRLKGGYLEAFGTLTVPKNLGTPGAPNSRAVANAGPAIAEVSHFPVLPVAGVPFRVFARVIDPDGLSAVTLRWRVETTGTFTSAVMHDDGVNGDTFAGDGLFTGTIPQQTAGTLIVFRIEATDAAPSPASALFPPDAPAHECLARVGEPAQAGDFGVYRIWLTSANVTTWASRAKFGNEPIDVTYVYGGVRAVYGGGAWYAGSEASTPGFTSPLGGLCGYNLTLPQDDLVLEENHISLDFPVRDVTDQREVLMFWMAEQLRLPNLYRRYVHLFVNGVRRGTIYDDVQQPDGTLIDEYFPDDNDGHLHKSNNWNESPDAANSVTAGEANILRHYDSAGQHKLARYRWTWRPRAARSANEFADLFSLIDAVNATTGYQAAIESRIDVENWMRTFAFHDLCSYWDGFGNPNHKNTYLYKPMAGRWTQFTWDMDVGLGVFNDPTNAALFPATVDTKVDALQAFAPFRRIYWQTISEAFATFFSGTGVTSQLQRRYDAFTANGIALTSPFVASGAYSLSITQWIDQRRTFLQGELNAVSASFAITSPANVTVTVPTVTISGTAPVTVATLTVNNAALPVTWTSVTAWSIPLVPASGTNPYVVRAFDGNGVQVGTGTVTVTFTGVNAWAALRINEWLAANNSTNADPADADFEDWVELYNPTASTVTLAGWTLGDSAPAPGVNYIIPNGYTIPAGGRLRIWCDDETVQSTTPGNLHVPFKLASAGETLVLRAPDGTLIDTVTFGQQYDDISQGRTTDGGTVIAYLTMPTPGTPNGGAAGLPGVSILKSGNVVTFTLSVLPKYGYQLEYKDDLTSAAWTPIGAPVTATSAVLTLSDPAADGPQRFYRVVRTP